ncbi:hypothetical protein IFM89_033561 [Coptis chinensis]|uniref:TAFII28-like protein domain-containing protein n=1 Tax=Coptis chinensis TaxID=261450 RepID=A0A835M086_9MAGN|nr:hypothetical protein IFM89_033561 [Coptis chinensis]
MVLMKQPSKDPFEVAYEEEEEEEEEEEAEAEAEEAEAEQELQEQDSPIAVDEPISATSVIPPDDDSMDNSNNEKKIKINNTPNTTGKNKEEEDEEDEENMDVELGKFPSSGDPDKMAMMQAILSQFTEEQMSRYESFRRSGFQKANMKKLIASVTGSPKVSVPMTIVVSGIAKMFVGELVEIGRIVMNERKETGPLRPCHIREAYRRLKLDGKIPKRSVPRLFR